MTPLGLLRLIDEHGIEMAREGDHLRYRCPRGVLTEEIKTLLAARKADLLDLVPSSLAAEPDASAITNKYIASARWIRDHIPKNWAAVREWVEADPTQGVALERLVSVMAAGIEAFGREQRG